MAIHDVILGPMPATATMTTKSNEVSRPQVSCSIVDIRSDRQSISILSEIRQGLRSPIGGAKTLPTLLLYDMKGLQLFEKITYLNEYYLTNTEIEILEKYSKRIAERIQPNSIILELGSGNLRKIGILLDALDRQGKKVDYYALDLSFEELQRTLEKVPKFNHVQCHGLHGTYDDGLEWLKTINNRPKAVLSIGSSIGNFPKKAATSFLKKFASILNPSDMFVLGIDACSNPGKVFHAYNDVESVTHDFILNGLEHANQVLGSEDFDTKIWKVSGEYRYAQDGGRHVAFVTPTMDVVIDGITIKKDEKIQIEESNKFSPQETERMFENAGLLQGARFSNKSGDYAIHMAYKPYFSFPTCPREYASDPVPNADDWSNLWAIWDVLTKHMIPHDELVSKPIKLRNACIFYLGHIPTFLEIHLSKATGDSSKQLDYYQSIFERGIDPDVDNPELCHDHSETPDTWPPVESIYLYQNEVRDKALQYLQSSTLKSNYHLRKALWLGFEHEVMHLETLLYMLIQSEKTLPPPGVVQTDFEAYAALTNTRLMPSEWLTVPAAPVSIGLQDPDTTESGYFGWDNEIPQRQVKVPAFQVRSTPITIGEYASFLEATRSTHIPASWVPYNPPPSNGANGTNGTNGTNGINGTHHPPTLLLTHALRTVFGPIPLRHTASWPMTASYDELAACAAHMGGHIPTAEQVLRMYAWAEAQAAAGGEPHRRSECIPAVNAEMVNEGVEETPPGGVGWGGESGGSGEEKGDGEGRVGAPDVARDHRADCEQVFVDLEGANVGFKGWHPTPIMGDEARVLGRCEMGGVWEWTSTVLEQHKGFKAMPLYPGYTADFFDGKHNIILGGSWATHPRVAGRKTFVNWYQRNYPYVWAGTRMVRDI